MDAIINKLRKRFERSRGQTMVEFALALPIILLLLFGLLEMGRLLFFYSSVFTASREGARYGSAAGYVGASTTRRYADCAGIRQAAKKLGAYAGVSDGTVEIKYDKGPNDGRGWGALPDCPSDPKLGERVVVRVTTTYSLLVPLLGIDPFEISSTTARTILKDIEVGGKVAPGLPTLTPTRTATATATPIGGGGGGPTATSTATATPTATPTPSVDCNKMKVVAGLTSGNFSVSMDIRNDTGEDTSVSSMFLSWDDDKNKLQSVLIGNATVWTGSLPADSTISSWSGDTSLGKGSINDGNWTGEQKSFVYNFGNNIKNSHLTIAVNFANSCTVVRSK